MKLEIKINMEVQAEIIFKKLNLVKHNFYLLDLIAKSAKLFSIFILKHFNNFLILIMTPIKLICIN